MIRRLRNGGSVGFAMLLLAAPAAFAEDAPTPARANEVLRAMTDTLAAAEHLSFHAEIEYDVLTKWGGKVLLSGASDIVVSRPDSVYVDFRDDVSARRLWLDGETATILDPGSGFYARQPAQGEIDAAVNGLKRRSGLTLPLAELVSNDPYRELSRGVERAYYLGIHDADGVACHHLAFVQEEIDWQIWVELGDRPVPRKVVVSYKTAPGGPQFAATLMDWELDAAPAASSFQPELPADALAIDFLELPEGVR